ncbi:MAG: VWA domain-containing protein [Pseudomonadota bacterium]
MSTVWDAFHFIRPFWLLVALPILILWWVLRPANAQQSQHVQGIAPHLATALEVGRKASHRFYPIDGVALIGVLLAVATAGPTWSRLPNPLVSETAPLVVALKVTPSMETPDLAPTRLDRARFKILDLIAARAGARTALVAYAGSAHRVAPLTEDPNILRPLVDGLAPDIMPVDGDDASAALNLASQILATAETPGAVLFVLDDLNPADVPAFAATDDPARPPVVFLIAAPDSVAIPQLDQIPDARTVRITADTGDVDRIERILRSAHQAALANDDRLQWADRGWWLAWPVALLVALWFRRGWTMRWAAITLAAYLAAAPGTAHADGWIDWFLTPDQQGWLAYKDKRFADAGDLFQDPMWQGYAKYRAGQYEDAITVFQRLDTPDAAFAQGMAEIKNRQYRPAVRSFETALGRQPDFPEAAENLDIAKAIVAFVETTREQSDTGEESGIGADDVVFDNETAQGAETRIDAVDDGASSVNPDQWIEAIDTDMGDFLRSRFRLENAQRGQ